MNADPKSMAAEEKDVNNGKQISRKQQKSLGQIEEFIYASTDSVFPSATPGIGDCKICFEVVPCLKVLDCGHCICAKCASQLLKDNGLTIKCPECRCTTNVAHGAHYLPSIYFGKVKCDYCLSQKEAEDMWWCNDCAYAICSKCNLKEHSKFRQHEVSEWNKLDQIKYSMRYINGVRLSREKTANGAVNRNLVRGFLGDVEQALQRQLARCNDLEELRRAMLKYYGCKFSQSLPTNLEHSASADEYDDDDGDENHFGTPTPLASTNTSPRRQLSAAQDKAPPQPCLQRQSTSNPMLTRKRSFSGSNVSSSTTSSSSTMTNQTAAGLVRQRNVSSDSASSARATEMGQKIVEKVLQLAGHNISQASLPRCLSEQGFQISFSVTPEEVASFIASKIQFLPMSGSATIDSEESSSTRCSSDTSDDLTPSAVSPSVAAMTRQISGGFEVSDERQFAKPRLTVQQAKVLNSGTVVLRCESEVFVNTPSNAQLTIMAPVDRKFCDISVHPKLNSVVVVVLHSRRRNHDWMLQSWDLSDSTIQATGGHRVLYFCDLDIDPEDRVQDVSMSLTSGLTMYELRCCQGNVSEIFKLTPADRKCKENGGSRKVKEVMLYQKSDSKFTQLSAFEVTTKQLVVVVWDNRNRSLLKLCIKGSRCETVTPIFLSTTNPPSFSLDLNGFLWLCDTQDSDIKASQVSLGCKCSVALNSVIQCKQPMNSVLRLFNGIVMGVSLALNTVTVTKYAKNETPPFPPPLRSSSAASAPVFF